MAVAATVAVGSTVVVGSEVVATWEDLAAAASVDSAVRAWEGFAVASPV